MFIIVGDPLHVSPLVFLAQQQSQKGTINIDGKNKAKYSKMLKY